jgi:hypothetical protein
MGKYNEELTKTGVMFAGEGLHPSSKDGGWAVTGWGGGEGGYALAREFLTVRKPQSVSFRDAAVLPMCILSLCLQEPLRHRRSRCAAHSPAARDPILQAVVAHAGA